jgi:hypothetical protein
MSMARRCDICGAYFDMPDPNPYRLDRDEYLNYVHLHRAMDPEDKNGCLDDYLLRFDACDKCYDDLLTYILARKAMC